MDEQDRRDLEALGIDPDDLGDLGGAELTEWLREMKDPLGPSRGVILALAVTLAAIVFAVFGCSPMASAGDELIRLPVEQIVRGAPGSTTQVASVPLDPSLDGLLCEVRALGLNGDSVHAGNDYVVRSNGSQVVLSDVERAPGVTTEAAGLLELGSSLSVELVLGADGIHSGGITVEVSCDLPTTTTEEEPSLTTETSTPPTTEPPASTTSSSPPPEEPETSSPPSSSIPTAPSSSVPTETTSSDPGSPTTSEPTPSSSSEPPRQESTSTSADVLEPPQELPRTGTETNVLVLVALGLIAGGASLLVLSRRVAR